MNVCANGTDKVMVSLKQTNKQTYRDMILSLINFTLRQYMQFPVYKGLDILLYEVIVGGSVLYTAVLDGISVSRSFPCLHVLSVAAQQQIEQR